MSVWITMDTSDYYVNTITGVWSTEEAARRFGGDDAVEEWELDRPYNNAALVERTRYYCRMGEDGMVLLEENRGRHWIDPIHLPKGCRWSREGKGWFWSESYVSAEHARLLCEERRLAWLREKETRDG